jgi:hypothetical protein
MEPSPGPVWVSGLLALAVFATHLFTRRLEPLVARPGLATRAFAAGVTVSYVLLVLLPEVAEAQERVPGPGGHESWYAVLAGLVLFHLASGTARRMSTTDESRLFDRVALGAFVAYYAALGYVLAHRSHTAQAIVFTVAIAMHVLASDHILSERHGTVFDRGGRLVMGLAVLAGWGVGAFIDVPERLVDVVIASAAGAVVLSALQDELPSSDESQPVAFLVGAAGFALLHVFR